MAIILPANTLSAGGYEVANSCRFDDGDSPSMSKTPGASSNRRTFTFSAWVKRSTLGSGVNVIFSASNSGNRDFIYFEGDALKVHKYNSGYDYKITTNRLFRDVSAWYHIVAAFDTTQGTASNRIKVYVNGVQETSLADSDYPSEDFDTNYNTVSLPQTIGKDWDASNYFDGYIAEVVMIDGSALAPTSFGEFDSDTPTIWKPKDVSGLTFGTNGFYLDFEDSSNLGNDANGGTDLTESNLAATDQATDTPTNNFCTINSLQNWYADPTLSEGNCKAVNTSGWGGIKGTMAVSKGKWYWEIKLSGTMGGHMHGVQEINIEGASAIDPQALTGGTMHFNQDGGEMKKDNTNTTADYGIFNADDIMGIALNMDGGSYGQISIYDNNSAIVSNYDLSSSSDYVAPFSVIAAATAEYNFGGCSAFTISSAASDENGYGAFEYAPPSGYYALCTKNLAEYG